MGQLATMDELERRVADWASSQQDIRTVMIVGSRARTEHPADEWSDLDVAFTTTRARHYLTTTAWLHEIGDVWTWYADSEGITRHVLFAGGLDAGLAPISHPVLRAATQLLRLRARRPELLQVLPKPVAHVVDHQLEELVAYCRRGVRLLVDKDGSGAAALAYVPRGSVPPSLPTADEFDAIVNEFWFVAVWNAKHLRRGELWAAKTVACDGQMKTLLLRMIEWHARAVRGTEYDTWERGRFLEGWADPEIRHDLRGAFAHYDEDDLWRASFATMDLFRRIAAETAEHLGLDYPIAVDARVTDWITACDAQRRLR